MLQDARGRAETTLPEPSVAGGSGALVAALLVRARAAPLAGPQAAASLGSATIGLKASSRVGSSLPCMDSRIVSQDVV